MRAPRVQAFQLPWAYDQSLAVEIRWRATRRCRGRPLRTEGSSSRDSELARPRWRFEPGQKHELACARIGSGHLYPRGRTVDGRPPRSIGAPPDDDTEVLAAPAGAMHADAVLTAPAAICCSSAQPGHLGQPGLPFLRHLSHFSGPFLGAPLLLVALRCIHTRHVRYPNAQVLNARLTQTRGSHIRSGLPEANLVMV